MGIFADVIGMKNLQKIKTGAIAKLSISQITCLITNMPDAQKKLSNEDFQKVYSLYTELRKCTTKIPMDLNTYTDTALKIIKKFDEIAPYEKFSGGNELEYSFLMQDIRNEDRQNIMEGNSFDTEDYEYIKNILDESHGLLNENDAKKHTNCYTN